MVSDDDFSASYNCSIGIYSKTSFKLHPFSPHSDYFFSIGFLSESVIIYMRPAKSFPSRLLPPIDEINLLACNSACF